VQRIAPRRSARAPWSGAAAAFVILVGLVGCSCEEPSGPAPEPEPEARRSLDEYLDDVRVAAADDEVATIPPWEGMGRRERTAPQAGELPATLDIWDLAGEVGDLPEPDERMGEDALRRVLSRADELSAADPANLLALWHATAARQLLGDAEAALQGYNRLVIAAPGLVEAHVQRGILLGDLFRFEASLDQLDYAERFEPSWDIFLNRGIVLCFAKRFDESEWDLWKAVEADRRDGNAYWDLAWVYAQRGQAEPTVQMLRFAARDRELFSRRFTRDKVRYDVFLSAVGHDPLFVAYTELLPPTPFVDEPDDSILRGSARSTLQLPEDAPDGVEPGSRGGRDPR
jgi:tetratricopeptide (TPR) repeat protein